MTDIRFLFAFAVCLFFHPLYALTARQAALEAEKKATADESVEYIEKTLKTVSDPADRRSLYALLGSIQEQLSRFDDARDSYAAAAAIAAGDAAGMPRKSSEQLVLDAVRCALDTGDYETAQSYLNSDVRNSQDETVLAYVRLYTEWCDLCRADGADQVSEPLIILSAYSDLPSMRVVKPAVLLTLWYITGKSDYADTLKKEFPGSPETAIVSGTAVLLPAPFWYFVPRQAIARPEITGTTEDQTPVTEKPADDSSDSGARDKIVCQQLGLFREKANAEELVRQLQTKGFSAAVTAEKRPSGTTYYIVAVNENGDKTMGDRLRSAGFECYPVFRDAD